MKNAFVSNPSTMSLARSGLGLVAVIALSAGSLLQAADLRPSESLPPDPAADRGFAIDSDDLRTGEFAARAREAILRRSGRSVATVDQAVASRSPLTLTEVFVFKVTDVDGFIHEAVLDEFGRELPPDFLRREVEEAALARGPVHPDLQAALDAAIEEANRGGAVVADFPVLIWLRMPESAVTPRPDLEARFVPAVLDEFHREAERSWKRRTAEETAKMVAKMGRLGLAGRAIESAPMVSARLDAAGIASLAALPEVLDISLDAVASPAGNVQRQVIGAHLVNNSGITGTGSRIGVIEVGGRVASGHPFLTGNFQSPVNSCLSWHTALVAGIIDSLHPEFRGSATGAQLWIGGTCAGYYSEAETAMTSARQWGANVLNLSWGVDSPSNVPDVICRFVDGQARNFGVSVVVAAGNRGQLPGQNITNPGNAYNGITVGATDDRNTVAAGDDLMWPGSSFKDPPSTYGDRQLPSVVAPGANIRGTTNDSPFVNVSPGASGTSLSAPAVSSTAALIMQRNTSLRQWPETVKAILMTTAIQNIEGDTRLGDRDGAGGLRANVADQVVQGIRGGTGGVTYDCSSATNRNLGTMSLVAGKRTRVTICWNTDPNYQLYASQPGADLDLQIVAPNGTVVAASSSWDNTFEIVDFTPTSTGTYTIRAFKYRCNASPGYLGWSWWRAQ